MPDTEWLQEPTPMGVGRRSHTCSVISTNGAHEIVVVGGVLYGGNGGLTDSVEIFNFGVRSWRVGKNKHLMIPVTVSNLHKHIFQLTLSRL